MTTIVIDGLNEEDFRREIESDLRHGREVAAAERLRKLLIPYAGPGAVLPERFLTVTAEDLALKGWDYLEDCIRRHDRPGRPVTALSIAFGWAGDEVPEVDAQGHLHPHIETGYFNDAAYPFSQSSREDLLDGYSLHGCTWAADCEASDNALSLDGVDDLNGALAALEARLLASEEPDPEEICAGSLGACLMSVLLFQAVSARIAADGLPRAVCVMAGSNGVYPYFDAPVAGMPEGARKAAALAEEAEEEDEEVRHAGVPVPRYSSLLLTGIPRAQKRAVLVLQESEEEMAVRIAKLRGLNHPESPAPAEVPIVPEPAPEPEVANLADGLLMTKKPSGQSWDFRDLLSPLPGGPDAAPEELDDWPEPESESVTGFEPEGDWDHEAENGFEPEGQFAAEPESDTHAAFEPAPEPEPETLTAVEPEYEPDIAELPSLAFTLEPPAAPAPVPEPGFTLIEETIQGRLQSLLASQIPEPPSDRVDPMPYLPEQAGPVWPFGPDWTGEEDSPCAALPDVSAAEKPVGLWARLRTWIRLPR